MTLLLGKGDNMIGYVFLGTNDLPRATAFYDGLLAEMQVSRLMEFGGRGYGWAESMDKPMLCVMKPYDDQPATVSTSTVTFPDSGCRRLFARRLPDRDFGIRHPEPQPHRVAPRRD
jgi:catechol 2,3-dioxygenase-like lactoylglutathione lyase family enzyme